MKQKHKPTFHLFFALIGGFLLITPTACMQPKSQLTNRLNGGKEYNIPEVDEEDYETDEEYDTEEEDEDTRTLRQCFNNLDDAMYYSKKSPFYLDKQTTLSWTKSIAKGSKAMRDHAYKLWLEYDLMIEFRYKKSKKFKEFKDFINEAKEALNLTEEEKKQARKSLRIHF